MNFSKSLISDFSTVYFCVFQKFNKSICFVPIFKAGTHSCLLADIRNSKALFCGSLRFEDISTDSTSSSSEVEQPDVEMLYLLPEMKNDK